jgi:peptidyl-prolyl cis-trans isomerase SurA
MRGKLWWMLALGLFLASAGSARAAGDDDEGDKAGEVIERVVAIVNGEPMLLSELRTRAAPFLPRLMQNPSEVQRIAMTKQLYGELLTQLIDERLLEQEARKLSISVGSGDIDRAVENVQRQSGLESAAFWEAVRGQGFTPEQYKADVRRQLLRLKVVNQKVRARINITEEDVKRKYDEQIRKARRSAQFKVANVFLPADPSSATRTAEVKAQAEALIKKLTVENFDNAMTEHGGGDLGWVSQSDLPESLSEALLGMEPGQISGPVRGPQGIHIFLLRERKEGTEAVGSYEQVKNDIYRDMVDQSLAKQEAAYLDELRKRALITRRL